MIMEKNWKLNETLVIGVFDDSEAIIADANQKTCVKEIEKRVSKLGGKKLVLENSNFSIRLCGVNLMINHPEFEKELSLSNQAELQDIVKIINFAKIENGIFEGNNWSLLMDSHKNFLPAREGIKIYDVAEVEMIRRFSIVNSSKTSKWEAGYSYCDENKTYYYLGTICSWKAKNSLNSVYGPQECSELHMVLDSNDFRPKAGQTYTVTELIKNYFGKITFLKKRSNLIKIKTQVATDDFVNYVPLLEEMINNWYTINKTTYSSMSNLITYKEDLSRLFKMFEYSTAGEPVVLSTNSINKIREILNDCVKYTIVKYWEKNYIHDTKKTFQEMLFNFFDEFFRESDVYNKQTYYQSLIEKVSGIDINNIITESIDKFDPSELDNNWKNYINNIVNVESCYGELTDFLLDDSSEKNQWHYGYHQRSKTQFTDEESKIFEKIIDFCRETSKSSSEYYIKNSGTLAKPKYIEKFTITIDTIVRMYGDDVPEDVQRVLINGRFKKVIIKKDYTV